MSGRAATSLQSIEAHPSIQSFVGEPWLCGQSSHKLALLLSQGAPVGASGKVHQELGLWARDDEGDSGVCLMSRYWASWQGSGRGMAEAEWDFFSCKSSCEAIHRLWDSSWVTSCYWRLVYSRCCSMVSLSVSVEHKDSSINFTETRDICHLSVLLWPFYNLLTSAGGWGATAPLIGHQLSVLLPSHLAGMCF